MCSLNGTCIYDGKRLSVHLTMLKLREKSQSSYNWQSGPQDSGGMQMALRGKVLGTSSLQCRL